MNHLRPTTALELFDRTFLVLKLRPGLLLGLGALGALLSQGAELLKAQSDPESSRLLAGAVLLALAGKWPLAALLMVAFQTMLLPRRPLEFGAAMRGAFSRLPHLLLTYLLSDSVLGLIGFVLPGLLLSGPSGHISVVPATTAALAGVVVACALYLAALWALVPAVVLFEERMLFDALGRSAELMRLRFSSRLFGDSALRRLVMLLLFAVIFLLGLQLTVPAVGWMVRGMPLSVPVLEGLARARTAVPSPPVLLLSLGVSWLFWSWVQAALAALYVECRMRSEGLDLQTRLMAREGAPELS